MYSMCNSTVLQYKVVDLLIGEECKATEDSIQREDLCGAQRAIDSAGRRLIRNRN